ncbi:hypothetical protein LAW41_16080, partial [Escherichia coli]|nr:hypothetical protein [Escherichia coli]
GDFIVDTENKYGMRYSVLVPYAKKSKLTIDRVRVAIPEELGKAEFTIQVQQKKKYSSTRI